MRPEDKDLLLKYLCAILPYGVMLQVTYHALQDNNELTVRDIELGHGNIGYCFTNHWIDFKPYLRPMSSMTEEEYKEYDKACELDCSISSNTLKTNIKARKRVLISAWYNGTDWLNAHHFDYRGLIEKGLALEAPEGMYKL